MSKTQDQARLENTGSPLAAAPVSGGPRLTAEIFAYSVLFGLALAWRLWRLEALPLGDSEAREALTVWHLIRGVDFASLPASPAYFFLTLPVFFVAGASDFTARLVPALLGAGLVWLPLFFRERLGRPTTLVTAGLLAISACVLAASRTADGLIITAFALTFGLGAVERYRQSQALPWLAAAGGALGLGLAGGASCLTVALIATVATLISALFNSTETREDWRALWTPVYQRWQVFGMAAAGVLVVVTTVGLVYRPGAGALALSWQNWVNDFVPSATTQSPLELLLFLGLYEPLLLVFGLIGGVRVFVRNEAALGRLGYWLVCFSGVALVFALIYNGRSPAMLIWVLAPLMVLAAQTLVELVRANWEPEEWQQLGMQIGTMLVLLVFAGLGVATYAHSHDLSRLGMAGVALLMAGIIAFLFGFGWSPRSGVLGAGVSVGAVLLALNVNAAWGLTQARLGNPSELWWRAPATTGVNRLAETVREISGFALSDEHDIDLAVQAAPAGALAWALRDFTQVQYVDRVDPSIAVSIVIAPLVPGVDPDPALGSAYAGDAFMLYQTWPRPALTQADWPSWQDWLLSRKVTLQSEGVVLWVRQDVHLLKTTERQK